MDLDSSENVAYGLYSKRGGGFYVRDAKDITGTITGDLYSLADGVINVEGEPTNVTYGNLINFEVGAGKVEWWSRRETITPDHGRKIVKDTQLIFTGGETKEVLLVSDSPSSKISR
ncbi:hypothetical protein DJ73_06260 [Halorubrum sp. Ea1]|nr:hypothetical protein DJ73_06260 [Halorubrum sp. Ea1]